MHSLRRVQSARTGPSWAWRFIALTIITSLVLGASELRESPVSAAPATTFEVVGPEHVEIGEPIEFTLRVKGANDLAAFETTALFDTTVVEYYGMEVRENDLRKLHRDVIPLAAVEAPYGAAIGLATCPVDDCARPGNGRQDMGGRGTVHLGAMTVVSHEPGTFEFRFTATKVVDVHGNASALPEQTLTVQVGEAGEGSHHAPPASPWELPADAAKMARSIDVAPDGRIAFSDAMEIAMAWTLSRELGAPCSTIQPEADVNGDGCIDVADLQLIGVNYGSSAPEPAPPPSPMEGEEEDPATEEAATAEPEQAPTSSPGSEEQSESDEPPATEANETEATESEPVDPEQQPQTLATFVVNATGDGADAKIGDGICRTSAGNCTLRAAIQEANNRPGPDTITFNIPGSGPHTIKPNSQLPALWDPGTTIDGYTQPGASPNTNQQASNAKIMIQLEGKGEGQFPGLRITSSGNTIRGLAIYKFHKPIWIYGNSADNNTIAGNFIGTNAAGTYRSPQHTGHQAHGIHMEQGASNNAIGTPNLANRNVISGNARHGVGLWHGGTNNNLIRNNLIGLVPAGNGCLSNATHGVDINYGSSNNIVGGTNSNERNVITGNANAGVDISHGANTTGNQIVGNYLGTGVGGRGMPSGCTNNLLGLRMKDGVRDNIVRNNVIGRNRTAGIDVQSPPTPENTHVTTNNTIRDNWIGVAQDGTPIPNPFGILLNGKHNTVGPNNVIAHNNQDGIWMQRWVSDFNRITRNSFYSNGGLGIDLQPDGVNPNDPGDTDTGPNEARNFPVLTNATTSSVTGTACAGCTVEIFVADVNSAAHGEGKTFVGSGTANGSGAFTISISGVSNGNYLTATATDPDGNTSEFSRNIPVGGGSGGAISLPGRIEAEAYGTGGEGVSYHDTTPGNSGGACRGDDVDLAQTSDTGGGCNVGFVDSGEWLRYQVNVTQGGNFTFVARVATINSGRRFRVEVDGQNVSGSVSVPNTGGWQTWRNVSFGPVSLSSGTHQVRIFFETGGFNLNYLDVKRN